MDNTSTIKTPEDINKIFAKYYWIELFPNSK
jgi:hypothetical protein